MDVSVAATTNWNLIAGTDIAKSIQTNKAATEDFVKPQLDDILSAESAILLGSGTDAANQPTCEFSIRLFPQYKIDSLTVVCTSSKIELFTGAQCEYVETIYGERLEGDEEDDDIQGYRYDVEVHQSGVTTLMLKLITTSNELCIYGIQLNIAPNPNGITTLLPNTINLDNVKEMLNNSNQKLSPSAEKCKKFLETYKSAMASEKGISGNIDLMEEFKKSMNMQGSVESKPVDRKLETMSNAESDLKNYIDEKLRETENRILKRINDIEESQNRKLDQILRLLDSK